MTQKTTGPPGRPILPPEAEDEILNTLFTNMRISSGEIAAILKKHNVSGDTELLQDRYRMSAPVRFCNFSPNGECKKMADKGVQPLNDYTCRFRPSSLKCTDKSGLDGLQADK